MRNKFIDRVIESPTFVIWLMASLSSRLLKITILEVKHISVKGNDKFIFRAGEVGPVEYLRRTIQ